MNIRKDYSDVASVLEYPYCFVSVCSFSDPEAGILERTSGSSSTMSTAGIFALAQRNRIARNLPLV